MGDTDAQQVLSLGQQLEIFGRHNGQGMNPNDGCASSLSVLNNVTYARLTAWSAIETKNVSVGLSNGTGWANSQGYYCSTWRPVLGGLLTLQPDDRVASRTLNWLNNAGALTSTRRPTRPIRPGTSCRSRDQAASAPS